MYILRSMRQLPSDPYISTYLLLVFYVLQDPTRHILGHINYRYLLLFGHT